MIRKIQARFVRAAMLSVALVLLVIMSAINILNYQSIVSDADQILSVLAENDGSFPSRPEDFKPDSKPDEKPDASTSSDDQAAGNSMDSETQTGEEPDGSGIQVTESSANSEVQTGEDSAGSGMQTAGSSADAAAEPDEGAPAPDAPAPGSDGSNDPMFSAETPFESRYFTVTFDSAGNFLSADTDNIAAVSEKTAVTWGQDLLNAKEKGFYGYYRYLVHTGTGDTTMVLFLDCQRSLVNFRSFLFVSVLVSLIGFAAVFVLVLLFSRRIVRPAQESYEKQKRFITDAGHELKTPLTIIDADVSVLEMDTGENEWLDDVKVQTKRLAGLTNDLIYLSRMDEGGNRLQMIDFPISDVVSDTAQSFHARAQIENKTFTTDIEPMLSYCGDEKSLTRLVSILLDNAIKYSDDRGTIRLSLKRRGKSLLLSVYNTADAINPQTLTHMFDRFYRGDPSRNSEKSGYGIGLSIASAVVSAHKGKISASSEDGKSLLITVTLP